VVLAEVLAEALAEALASVGHFLALDFFLGGGNSYKDVFKFLCHF